MAAVQLLIPPIRASPGLNQPLITKESQRNKLKLSATLQENTRAVLGKSKTPKDSLMFITKRPDLTFVRGEGSYLYDEQGGRYLDFIQGWAVNSLGHSPRIVRDALNEQASRVVNVSPAYYNEPMCRLAELLAELSGLDRVFFANSGAEANEGAIKLVRKWGSVKRDGAYEIIAFEGAFHGRTLATMSASGKPQWKDLYEPKVSGFVHVPVNDIEAVARAITAYGWRHS